MKNSSIAFDKDDRYELHFGIVRAGQSGIKGIVDLRDMLFVDFDEADGTYFVGNLDGSDNWVGVDTDKNRAIIKYLCKRLDITMPIAEEVKNER